MSASERLKALDEAMTDGPWRARQVGAISEISAEVPHEFESEPVLEPVAGEMFIGDGEALATLRNALPELIAVVEAAEKSSDGDWPNTWVRIADALAALDAKLSVT